jgi:phosphatidylserine decarboxylase
MGIYNLFIALVLVHFIIYFLLRKKPNRFRDDPVTTAGVVFSPANGKIVSIIEDNDKTKIEISLKIWKEMGIFLPITAEIKNLWRTQTEVILELDNRLEVIEMHFVRQFFGFWPDLIVTPGDKGARRVNIGFFPFGGTVLLYLPKKYEILIKDQNVVIAGETIIAVLPEKI